MFDCSFVLLLPRSPVCPRSCWNVVMRPLGYSWSWSLRTVRWMLTATRIHKDGLNAEDKSHCTIVCVAIKTSLQIPHNGSYLSDWLLHKAHSLRPYWLIWAKHYFWWKSCRFICLGPCAKTMASQQMLFTRL